MVPRSKLSADNISNIRRLAIFIPLKISFSFDICHQLQIVSLSKRMKFLIVFVAFFGLAFGSDLFTGSWKEDQYKRENLGDYLYERGTFLLFFHYSYLDTLPRKNWSTQWIMKTSSNEYSAPMAIKKNRNSGGRYQLNSIAKIGQIGWIGCAV